MAGAPPQGITPQPSALQAASDLLYDLWQQGRCIEQLPEALRPATRAAGYAVQALLEPRSARPLYGWKIAATSVAGQRHIGVDAPLAGRLLAERVLENGGCCDLCGNAMRLAELEFAFRMGAELPPRPEPYSEPEVMARVAALHPALEFPDSRLERYASVGAPQLIADNACGHLFLLGAAAPECWRALDLAAHAVRGVLDQAACGTQVVHPGIGRNVLGDPRTALTWLVNELSHHGATLHAGQFVTTGTCGVPIPVAPGDRLRGDFGLLGEVMVSFEE